MWVSGFLDEPTFKRHLAAADVIALPFELVSSDVPLSVLEAEALGKPIVATRTVCLPEMIPPNVGMLATPADVGSLAGALNQLAADPARRANMANHAREFAAQWGDWSDRNAQWEQLLQAL